MSLIKHTANFTTISNHILHSKDLTWKAKGIYAYLNSKPENWAFSIERIARESNDTTYSTEQGIKELKQSGLLVQKARLVKNSKGQNILSGQEYHLYSEIKKVKESENKEPSTTITVPPNFRHTETPPHGNPATLNKTIINKTEYKKIENKENKENTVDFEVQSKTPNTTQPLNINSLSNFFGLSQEEKEDMDIFRSLNTLILFLSGKGLVVEDLEKIKTNLKQEEFTKNRFSKKHWGGWINDYQTQKTEEKLKQFTITKDPNYGKTGISYSYYLYHWNKGEIPEETTQEFLSNYFFN